MKEFHFMGVISSICRPPTSTLPHEGEGVDNCYRGKSLLPKLPRKLSSFVLISP